MFKKRKKTERQKIKEHNDEVDAYQLRTQGFTGDVYPIKSLRRRKKFS